MKRSLFYDKYIKFNNAFLYENDIDIVYGFYIRIGSGTISIDLPTKTHSWITFLFRHPDWKIK